MLDATRASAGQSARVQAAPGSASVGRGSFGAWLELPLGELLAERWRAGRAARGLAASAPFAWDRPDEIGLDELEELLDAAIYRRERYRAWYGRDESAWPDFVRGRLHHARREIEALRAELRLGPLSGREPRRAEGAT